MAVHCVVSAPAGDDTATTRMARAETQIGLCDNMEDLR
jgi:hypothetical protein